MTLDLQAIAAELEDRIKMTQHHPETVPTLMYVLQEHLAQEEQIPVITGTVTPDQLWAMMAGLERGDGQPVRVAVDCVITVTPRPQIDYTQIVGEIKGQGPLIEAETVTTQADPEGLLQIVMKPYGTGTKDGWVLSFPGVEDLRVPVDQLQWDWDSTGNPMLLSQLHDDLSPEERKEWVQRISAWLESVGRGDIRQGPIK